MQPTLTTRKGILMASNKEILEMIYALLRLQSVIANSLLEKGLIERKQITDIVSGLSEIADHELRKEIYDKFLERLEKGNPSLG